MPSDFNMSLKEDSESKTKSSPKLNILQTAFIGFGFMSCMFAWAMYNFYLPRILAGHIIQDEVFRVGLFTDNYRLFWTGVIMTLDNLAAILLQPYFGDLSDRLESKYGRRTPFLIVGIPLAAISMIIMPYAMQLNPRIAMFLAFVGLVLVFNVGMAIYRAPVVALMPDLTPSTHRSMANVIINVMGGIGALIGMFLPVLIGTNDAILSKTTGYTTYDEQDFFMMDAAIFWSSAAIILVILGLYLIFVKEKKTGKSFWNIGTASIKFDPDTLERIPVKESDIKPKNYSTFKEIASIKNAPDKSAWFMFLSLFFWTMAGDAFSTNYSLWGSEYAKLDDSFLGTVSLITTVALLILGYPGALISKKKGRIWTMKLGIAFIIISFAGLIIFQELGRMNHVTIALIGIIVCSVCNTFGGALIGIAAITVTWQLAPDNKVGTYTGLYYLFKQMGSVISPMLIGGIMSLLTPALGTTDVWVIFIPYCMLFSILFYWSFSHVTKGEVGDEWNYEELEKEIEENPEIQKIQERFE
jgi:maltose/moltooligosaccharide transporter